MPRCSAVCWATRVRPRPEPGLSRRRWKRRNTAARSSGGTPGPLSSTVSRACEPSAVSRTVTRAGSPSARPCTAALPRRLASMIRSPDSQPNSRSSAGACTANTVSGWRRRASSAAASTSSARSSGWNASNWTRSPRARALSAVSRSSSRAWSCRSSATTSSRSAAGRSGWAARMSRLVRRLISGVRSSCEASAENARAVSSAWAVRRACSS